MGTQQTCMSFLAALAPKAEFSFSDVVDEVHRLRDENELLRGQVALLTKEKLNPGSTDGAAAAAVEAAAARQQAEASAVAPAAASNGAEGGTAGAFAGLRAELKQNLGVDEHEAEASQARSLGEQLASSREELRRLQIERDATARSLAIELRDAEDGVLRGALEQEATRSHCNDLTVALQEQAALSRRQQAAAVADSRQQMAAALGEMEEQVLRMQEELARRDALQEDFGSEAELAAQARQVAEWAARCKLKEAEVARLRDEGEAAQRQFEPQLRRQRARADDAEAALAAAQKQAAAQAAVQRHMEAQVVRLSEAFNRQVEERDEVQAGLEASKRERHQMVEKGVARSWSAPPPLLLRPTRLVHASRPRHAACVRAAAAEPSSARSIRPRAWLEPSPLAALTRPQLPARGCGSRALAPSRTRLPCVEQSSTLSRTSTTGTSSCS